MNDFLRFIFPSILTLVIYILIKLFVWLVLRHTLESVSFDVPVNNEYKDFTVSKMYTNLYDENIRILRIRYSKKESCLKIKIKYKEGKRTLVQTDLIDLSDCKNIVLRYYNRTIILNQDNKVGTIKDIMSQVIETCSTIYNTHKENIQQIEEFIKNIQMTIDKYKK